MTPHRKRNAAKHTHRQRKEGETRSTEGIWSYNGLYRFILDKKSEKRMKKGMKTTNISVLEVNILTFAEF